MKYILLALCIGALALSGCNVNDRLDILEDYALNADGYCIEWDGWINRDSMMFNCMDFKDDGVTTQCYWEVDDKTQRLQVYQLDWSSKNYSCSKAVKYYNIVI